jgi:hypothetical protein
MQALLDQSVKRVQIVQGKPLAGLVSKRHPFSRPTGIAVDDFAEEGFGVIVKMSLFEPFFQHHMIDVFKEPRKIAF